MSVSLISLWEDILEVFSLSDWLLVEDISCAPLKSRMRDS